MGFNYNNSIPMIFFVIFMFVIWSLPSHPSLSTYLVKIKNKTTYINYIWICPMINAPFHHIIAELEWNPSNKFFKMIFLKKKKSCFKNESFPNLRCQMKSTNSFLANEKNKRIRNSQMVNQAWSLWTYALMWSS